MALLLASCAHSEPMPDGMIKGDGMPDRLYCVENDSAGRCSIYRSAQPTLAQFTSMRDRLGLKSDLKLNPAIEARDHLPDGIEIIDHPMSSILVPEEEDVDQICRDLEDAPKPALIHCTAGRERTGFIVERCVRMKQKPYAPSAQAMYAEWVAFGMRTWLAPGLIESFERATGFHP